jgi:GNAT superfamily N-acetyltransferase
MIHLRPERPEDADFLFTLFCSAREAEFAVLPEAQRDSLLRLQHHAQCRDYTERFPHAERLIIEFDRQPAGRLLLNRAADELRVIDIAVLSGLRGRGIASTLLKSLISEAQQLRVPLRLSVWRDNPAVALYSRLGFKLRTESATHLELEWRSMP